MRAPELIGARICEQCGAEFLGTRRRHFCAACQQVRAGNHNKRRADEQAALTHGYLTAKEMAALAPYKQHRAHRPAGPRERTIYVTHQQQSDGEVLPVRHRGMFPQWLHMKG